MLLIAGVDEAGRGPLFGPVYAAAVILPLDINVDKLKLNDSKKLSSKKREKLFDIICETALSWSIAKASVDEIDQFNILQASLLAMKRAVIKLNKIPDKILIDGTHAPKLPLSYDVQCIIDGDEKNAVISAASILAKVARDRELIEWDQRYPQYGFANHKGYPTCEHLTALKKFGPLNEHRRSFRPIKELLDNL